MERTYTLELTREELEFIHEVFDELTSDNLLKWTELVTEADGINDITTVQWKRTNKCNYIRGKVKELLKDCPTG